MRHLKAALSFVIVAAAAATALADDVSTALDAIDATRRKGDLAQAATLAGDLVAKHPESLEAHVVHQDLEIALGREKAVLESYRAAARAEGASADAHYLAARLLRGSAAVSELRAALKIDAGHFWSECALAAELTKTRAHGEARTLLDDAVKRRPASAVPLHLLGRLEEARNKPAEAEKQYRAALAADAKLTVARVNLGTLLASTGRKDAGLAQLAEAASDAPGDPFPHLAAAMVHRAAGDEKSALEAFKKAAITDPKSVTALNLLANSYTASENYDSAEETLQRALKLAPESASTLSALAYVHVQQTKFEAAIKAAMAAVAADDELAEAHYALALAYDRTFLPKKADPEYRRAAKLDEDNPDIARGCAVFAASQNDWTRAVAEYTRAAKLLGNSAESLMELASAHLGAGKPRAAASCYDQVVAADPNNLDGWLQLGIVCGRDLKENKRAVKAFKEYRAHGGKDPRVTEWIAKLEAN